MDPNSAPTPEERNSKSLLNRIDSKTIYIVTAVITTLVIVGALFAFLLLGGKTPNRPAQTQNATAGISGKLDINGVVPANSTVSIFMSEFNSNTTPQAAATNLPAIDEGSWSITNAASGKTYEVYAQVYAGNNVIAKGTPLVVTAPADGEFLSVNISGPAEEGQGAANATISGNVIVNGYIPSGATISVRGKPADTQTFTTIASNLTAQQTTFMSYTTAVAGQTYEIIGYLYDANGNQIGSSTALDVTAPAANETLTINSQAVAPSPTPTPSGQTSQSSSQNTISGTINFNGVIPLNSRIVIFQKVYNSTNYQVAVNNITPSNGTSWQWTAASPSTWYDMVAVLKQTQSNGTDLDIADSNTVSVAAPASNIQFTINSGVSLSAPSGQISVSCGNQSGSLWNATLTMPVVAGAQSYWYQVGNTPGSSNQANSTFNFSSSSSNPTAGVQLNNGQTYYFRYAYATVPNQTAGSTSYSPFSGNTQATCQ